MVLGAMVVILFIVLLIQMPANEDNPRYKIITKILIYFGLPAAVLLDIHHKKVKTTYMSDAAVKDADNVFNSIMFTGGNLEQPTSTDPQNDVLELIYNQ